MPAISVKFNEKQAKALTDKFKTMGDDAVEAFEEITKVYAQNIIEKAKPNIPSNKTKDISNLRGTLFYEKVREMTYKVESPKKYAAFVEFGTGTTVDVPSDWKELAWKFKGKGIKKINLPARPFLYPAYRSVIFEYVKKLEDELETLIKK